MFPLLNYGDVVSLSYGTGDITVVLSREQQALVYNMIAVFALNGGLWADYSSNSDSIDSSTAELLAVLNP